MPTPSPNHANTPRIAITIGDVAGIGPEIILKALRDLDLDHAQCVVFGALSPLLRADQLLSTHDPSWTPLRDRLLPLDSPASPLPDGSIGVFDVPIARDLKPVTWGQRHPAAAELQLAALHAAIDHARAGTVDALCTAPWNKEIFRLIDAPCTGHTEVLAARFHAPEHVMMLAGDRLRVALVTVHVPLADVPDHLTPSRLEATIRTVAADLRAHFAIPSPSLAVCGLNPHAGELGVMGDEELRVISPTLERLRHTLDDVSLTGPLPADTLFAKYRRGAQPWDAVICMYHDQGLIPLKLTHFGASANLTLGLPVPRTSVDHGTAYDIAGLGIADAGSMRYALRLAQRLATSST